MNNTKKFRAPDPTSKSALGCRPIHLSAREKESNGRLSLTECPRHRHLQLDCHGTMITTDAHVLRCARGLGAHSKRWPLGRHAISVPEKAECTWEMERI